jgi:hypothetical protein
MHNHGVLCGGGAHEIIMSRGPKEDENITVHHTCTPRKGMLRNGEQGSSIHTHNNEGK